MSVAVSTFLSKYLPKIYNTTTPILFPTSANLSFVFSLSQLQYGPDNSSNHGFCHDRSTLYELVYFRMSAEFRTKILQHEQPQQSRKVRKKNKTTKLSRHSIFTLFRTFFLGQSIEVSIRKKCIKAGKTKNSYSTDHMLRTSSQTN